MGVDDEQRHDRAEDHERGSGSGPADDEIHRRGSGPQDGRQKAPIRVAMPLPPRKPKNTG